MGHEEGRDVKRAGLIIAPIAVAAALVGFGVWRHHTTRPRFEVQVRPRAVMSKSECHAEVRSARSVGYIPPTAPPLCHGAGSAASFVLTVTNIGGRGSWVESCAIRSIDHSGDSILVTDVSEILAAGTPFDATHLFTGARYLEPGQSATYDWFVRGVAPERVAHYAGSCSYQESFSGPF